MNNTFVYDEKAFIIVYIVTFGFPLIISIIFPILAPVISFDFITLLIEKKIVDKSYSCFIKSINIIFIILGIILGIYLSILVSPYILVENSSQYQVGLGRFMLFQLSCIIVGVSSLICGIIGCLLGIFFIEFMNCCDRFLIIYDCSKIRICCLKWKYIFTGIEYQEKEKNKITKLSSNS